MTKKLNKGYSELNQIFWEAGIKNGSMQVDGIEVTKTLTRYTSNSRKSYDWDVEFTWEDGDGKRRSAVKESRYKKNRSNDPDRNFGLGRE